MLEILMIDDLRSPIVESQLLLLNNLLLQHFIVLPGQRSYPRESDYRLALDG